MPIDGEPRPRERPLEWRDAFPRGGSIHRLSRDVLTPDVPFFAVLTSRTSVPGGGAVSEATLASILWHGMLLRERRSTGRFGLPWESRNAPSAGGLHPLRLLVIPVGDRGVVGTYDAEAHAVLPTAGGDHAVRAANEASVAVLTGAKAGTTLQIVADPTKTCACYEDAGGLVLRDAGALAMTLCLVATALGASAVPLGRAGTDLVRLAGFGEPFVGLGAVHLGGLG